MEVTIGIDVGTQSTKALLYHIKTKKVLKCSSFSYDIIPTNISGRAEQNPKIWVSAVQHVLKEILMSSSPSSPHSKYEIQGIGVSGMQHGMVVLDKDFQVIRNAKLWCDVEASEEAQYFSQQASSVLNKNNLDIPAGFTAPKVLWLEKNHPEEFARMRYLCLPHDYITFLLCHQTSYNETDGSIAIDTENAKIITDRGDASGTGFFDPVTSQFLPELCNIIGDDGFVFNALPKIADSPLDIAGHLSEYWCNLLGMTSSQEKRIPISIGSGDNMMSALGVGCVNPNQKVLSLGTSGTIFGVSTNPPSFLLDNEKLFSSSTSSSSVAPFCDATGRYLPLVCVMSCTGILHDILSPFSPSNEQNNKLGHDEVTDLAYEVPPGCHGLVFIPFLKGERTPNWPHSKGSLINITSDNIKYLTNPGVMYRAALEGVAYTLKMAFEEMKMTESPSFEEELEKTNNNNNDDLSSAIMVVGGGSKNPLWRQILSDVSKFQEYFQRTSVYRTMIFKSLIPFVSVFSF